MTRESLPEDSVATMEALRIAVLPAGHHLIEAASAFTRQLAVPAGSDMAAKAEQLGRHFRGLLG